MWLFRPRLCLGFGKPAPDGIVPLLDKPLLRISDKAAALRLRDGVQLSDGTLHNLPCLPVTDNRHDFFQPRKGVLLRTGGVLINHAGQEYCGDILNFKTYSKSYKNKKRLENDRENWAIFKDVHEPIIERAVFEQVQQKRGKMRKRQAKDGERSMFSGLLVCADCGSNLHFHFNQGNPEIKYFNCSNYKGNRGTCGSTHYVRVDFLEQVVLGEIRRLTKYAGLYEDDFLKEVIGHSRQAEETERRLKEKELKSLLARDDELDGLFERIYEDNVSGKLSDDRFAKMSRRYEEEQKELSEKIKKLRSEIEKQSSRATSTDMFVSIVRKYTRARKLTPRMLNELVEKIEVYNAEKIDGEWVQRLRIHYNCVGEMNIPNEPALPIPAVTVNTRKGVFVSYTTDDRPAV